MYHQFRISTLSQKTFKSSLPLISSPSSSGNLALIVTRFLYRGSNNKLFYASLNSTNASGYLHLTDFPLSQEKKRLQHHHLSFYRGLLNLFCILIFSWVIQISFFFTLLTRTCTKKKRKTCIWKLIDRCKLRAAGLKKEKYISKLRRIYGIKRLTLHLGIE